MDYPDLLELTGGTDIHPQYPKVITFDISKAMRQLNMFTNNLVQLVAPPELCVQKALGLISDRQNYATNLEIFKLELLEEVLDSEGLKDVNSLVAGIDCVCKQILETTDNNIGTTHQLFPYEFHSLTANNSLMLVLINLDAEFIKHTSQRATASYAVPAYIHTKSQNQTLEIDLAKEYHVMDF